MFLKRAWRRLRENSCGSHSIPIRKTRSTSPRAEGSSLSWTMVMRRKTTLYTAACARCYADKIVRKTSCRYIMLEKCRGPPPKTRRCKKGHTSCFLRSHLYPHCLRRRDNYHPEMTWQIFPPKHGANRLLQNSARLFFDLGPCANRFKVPWGIVL